MNNPDQPRLDVIHEIPSGFLEATPGTLQGLLRGPTLMHLPGTRAEPLFVSVLLHGNENVGLLAVQRLLRNYENRVLPRALSVFVGNVAAAGSGMRRLDYQPDYNRIWPGSELPPTPEHAIMAEVVERMDALAVFASIDLHNNTGINPHYACINRIDHRFLQLAALFSPTVVFFKRPRGVQTMAFAELCPAVTCECGKVGEESGVTHAMDYMEACLHLAAIPDRPVHTNDVHVFHTVATVKVPAAIDFSFDSRSAPLLFADNIEHWNFHELPQGTLIARRHGEGARLEVWDERGLEAGEQFLDVTETEIRLRRSFMPAMLTRDTRIIRQDCLCYLMERYPLPQ
jgi:succinylglutamate desuccinylase